MVKHCLLCGKAIAITGDYHRANARKYCPDCAREKTARAKRAYDWGNRADKRQLHRETKRALDAAQKTIAQLMECNELLEQRNIQLRQELAEYTGV